MSGDEALIARCIAGVVRSKDGRGVWQNEFALYRRLHRNTTPTIAFHTAAAARRVGEAIADASRRHTQKAQA